MKRYLIEYINILNNASEKLSRTTSKRVVFEVAIIKLCKPQMQDGYEAMEKRIEELEVKLDSLGDVAGQMQNIVPAQLLGQSQNYMTMQQTGQQQNNMAMQQTGQLQEQQNSMQGDLVKAYSQLTPEQQSELSNQIVNNIRTTYPEPTATELLMIADLYQSYLSTVIRLEANFLSKAYLVPADEPGTLNLCVVKCEENKTVINYFERREHIDNLEKDMREKMGRELKINFMTVTAAQKEEKKLGGYDLSAIKNFHVDIVPK